MNLLTRTELKKLIDAGSGRCISLFMPTYKAGKEIKQNKIRFKNLIREAGRELRVLGLRDTEVKSFLVPAKSLLDSTLFWQHQSESLALFLSDKGFYYYSIPYSIKEMLFTSDRFHIKPILPLLKAGQRFYILSLDLHKVKIFQATTYNIHEIPSGALLGGIDEIIKYEESQEHSQFHTGALGKESPGRRPAMFHGHGGYKDYKKIDIKQFCQKIDKILHKILKDESAPLILAGTDYICSLYREINTYPSSPEDNIKADQQADPETLKKEALNIVKPVFEKERKEGEDLFNQLKHTDRVSNDLKKIVPSAYNGKIQLLFASGNTEKWGNFDPLSGECILHDKKTAGDDDLIDLASVYTLLHKGKVYISQEDKIPDHVPLAGISRPPVSL